MERRITEEVCRMLEQHGYQNPVFVGKGSFSEVYRVTDRDGRWKGVSDPGILGWLRSAGTAGQTGKAVTGAGGSDRHADHRRSAISA